MTPRVRSIVTTAGRGILLGAILLTALGWEEGPGYRRREVRPIGGPKAGFTEMRNEECGVLFTNRLSDARLFERQNLMNGAGVAVGDVDNDGQPEFFICNKEGPSALYRNLGGWKFEDITAAAGVACADQSSTGAAFADIDGDGWLDLIVTSFGGPNACFLNQRNGSFTNIIRASGIGFSENTTSIALGDLDADHDLDLYVNNFGLVSILRDGVSLGLRQVGGRLVATGRYAHRVRFEGSRMIELGEPDFLFWNQSGGQFKNAFGADHFIDAAGKSTPLPFDFGLAAQVRDMNGDGRPDIYTCNDFQTPDRFWINQGGGKFREAPALSRRNMSYAAMGVDFADIDRDGDMDFFVVEMLASDPRVRLRQRAQAEPYRREPGKFDAMEDVYRNTLYLNNGDGTYSEIARAAGLSASDWSWSVIFLDVDLDGYEDLLVTNGNADDLNDMDRGGAPQAATAKKRREPMTPLITPNAAFRNQRDLTFASVAAEWGFNSTRISHGAALGDFDGDGDLDVVVNCLNAPPLLYRNEAGAPRILARLRGRGPNTHGIGAKVTLCGANGFAQTQEILAGGRYLSGDEAARSFAASGNGPFTIEVHWPRGAVSTISNAAPNSIYEIEEPENPAERKPAPTPQRTLFADVSDHVAHRHHELAFDDFANQPLLPRRLSQAGPGLAWGDVNGDDRDDLVIGAGRGGTIAVLRNGVDGRFQTEPAPSLSEPLAGDSAGMLLLPGNPPRIITAISPWEREPGAKPELLIAPVGPGAAQRIEIPVAMTPGPLVLFDLDADGDLDLFVAGLSARGKYPEPAASCIFLNNQGSFVHDASRSQAFAATRLVTAAVATDLNADGWPDLALACEWGPLRVFINAEGQFTEATEALGLADLRGWWMSVSAGDFDGDGRMDLVAGNWGRNSAYQEFRTRPLRLYFGDWTGRGVIDQIEARFLPELNEYSPLRNMEALGKALPFLRQNFPTHRAFCDATLPRILAGAQTTGGMLEANWAETTVFLNRGARFEARPLPPAAQFSPVFGILVADFDGDASEDLFLAQNHFAARPDEERCDAGFGLLLRGKGDGTFEPVPAAKSGLRVYGEQRGCAAADYDLDSRIDLAITQNGAATKLYRNELALPGLRIALKGPASNPAAIGASIQLLAGERAGPAREIRAGQGYWSQDSPTQIMNWPGANAIRLRWPGGRTQTLQLPASARNIEIAFGPGT